MSGATPNATNHASLAPLASRFVEVAKLPWEKTRFAGVEMKTLLVDRETRRIAVIGSTEGGMDIEQVAHDTPEKILTMHFDPTIGFSPFVARKLAFLRPGLNQKFRLPFPSPITCSIWPSRRWRRHANLATPRDW